MSNKQFNLLISVLVMGFGAIVSILAGNDKKQADALLIKTYSQVIDNLEEEQSSKTE